jgi:uncharacterized membrane protein YdjX (TVP38/TMEM64 family)
MKLKIKYPKFLILILTFVLAYFIFAGRTVLPFNEALSRLGYLGSFIVGLFYTYGFTTGPAAALFLILGETQNIFIAGMLGGFGALLGDLLIFKLIRTGFDDEVRLLEHEHIIRYVDSLIPRKIKYYLAPIIGGLIIGSPLPDEIGVSIIAASRHVSQKAFMIISYTMNTLGIIILLWIGSAI